MASSSAASSITTAASSITSSISSTSSTASSTTSEAPLPTASGTPSDCQTSYEGTFPIQIVNTTTSRLGKRAGSTDLIISITDSVLRDRDNRTGYIASNDQFQFDSPVPSNAVYAAGWAVCPGGKVYLGSEEVFKECLVGNYYNLFISAYDGSSCNSVNIVTVDAGGPSSSNSTSTTSITTSASSTSSTGASTSSPAATAGQASGLSTGAKAGIGVGVALGALLLAGIAWFLINRRRGRSQVPADGFEPAGFSSDNKAHYELPPEQVYEAHGDDRPLEMGNTARAELDSNWTGWEMPTRSEP